MIKSMNDQKESLILVVDDASLTLAAINELLQEYGHSVLTCTNAADAMEVLRTGSIDVVLSDINMPETSGLQLLDEILGKHPDIPVILMTGFADLKTAVSSINRGAFDFILKPFETNYFINTIGKAVEYTRLKKAEVHYREELETRVDQKTDELMSALRQMEHISMEVVERFTKMAEYRDTDTGDHISRIGLYSNQLAKVLNMPDDFVRLISFSSSMHDIGKITIPDSILLKPGPLTHGEFGIMKTHTTIGKNILEGSLQPTIQMAESIAWNHHERWDGSGYPRGIKGDIIPLEAMIVMLADQYDALRSKRPYKTAFSHEEVFSIITEGNGRTMPGHFHPDVLKAFIEVEPVFNDIFNFLKDADSSSRNISCKDHIHLSAISQVPDRK